MIEWLFWAAYGVGFVGLLLLGYSEEERLGTRDYGFVWVFAMLWCVIVPVYIVAQLVTEGASATHRGLIWLAEWLNH